MAAEVAPSVEHLQNLCPFLPRSALEDILEQIGAPKALDYVMACQESAPSSSAGLSLSHSASVSRNLTLSPGPIQECPFTPQRLITQTRDSKDIMAVLLPMEQGHQEEGPSMTSEQQLAHFRSMFPSLPAHTISSVTQLHAEEEILDKLLKIQTAFDQPQSYSAEGGLQETAMPSSPCSNQRSWEAHSESSDSPADPLASLSAEEKVEALRNEFPSLSLEQVMTALDDENGRTDRAAALLQLYVQYGCEEEIPEEPCMGEDEKFCRRLVLEESEAKAIEEADAKLAAQLAQEESEGGRQSATATPAAEASSLYFKPPPPPPPKQKQWKQVLTSRSKAKIQHLNRCYPDAPADVLASTLAAMNNDIRSCKQLLSQSGLPEKRVRASTGGNSLSSTSPHHQIYAARPSGPGGRDGQHQALYEEARKLANDYREQARDRFRKSTEAKNKRQHEVSASFTQAGLDLMAKAKRENDVAAKRIFKGVNRTVNVWDTDVHGLHIPEARQKVEELIAHLTKLGDPVHLKIITGQGHHSADNIPKILPAMKQYLEQQGLEYSSFPGYFVVLLNTTDF
ncbi:hypothetical protein WJX84_009863 [Apatococcus fuscideae]|uniref:Smr domain-containing protein n=1 Tax=Apatococcus fuscideae TaxID=2026836 RepID=A0AAW1S047_9CHLO